MFYLYHQRNSNRKFFMIPTKSKGLDWVTLVGGMSVQRHSAVSMVRLMCLFCLLVFLKIFCAPSDDPFRVIIRLPSQCTNLASNWEFWTCQSVFLISVCHLVFYFLPALVRIVDNAKTTSSRFSWCALLESQSFLLKMSLLRVSEYGLNPV